MVTSVTDAVTLLRMTAQATDHGVSPSRYIAAELRAEIARRGLTSRQLALRHGLGEMWLNRRIGRHAKVDLTLEDVLLIAGFLEIPADQLAALCRAAMELPRLDSNQQPFGYAMDPRVKIAA